MDNTIYDILMEYAQNPWLLSFVLFLATFILEDAATSSGALISSQGLLPVKFSLLALIAGIIIGDLALFGLGVLASKSSWVRKQLDKKGVKTTKTLLSDNMVLSIILARFIPGMRLPTYVAMGLLKLDFKTFFMTVTFAVGIWTVFLFSVVYKLGENAFDMVGWYKWLSIAAIALLVILGPRLLGLTIKKFMPKKTKPIEN